MRATCLLITDVNDIADDDDADGNDDDDGDDDDAANDDSECGGDDGDGDMVFNLGGITNCLFVCICLGGIFCGSMVPWVVI